ncbi:pectinesterase, partial [Trifolium pratense]
MLTSQHLGLQRSGILLWWRRVLDGAVGMEVVRVREMRMRERDVRANHDKWNVNGATGQSLDFKLRQAESNRMNITVNPNGSADFKTITEAISSIPAPNSRRVVVFIAP